MDRRIFSLIITALVVAQAGCWSAPTPDRGSGNYGKLTTSSSPGSSPSPSATPTNDTMQTSSSASSDIKPGGFSNNLPPGFNRPSDDVGKRLLKEYGAVFMARGEVTPPPTVVFRDDSAVSVFQSGLLKTSENVGGVTIELQSAAMKALKEASTEANQSHLTITPRGPDAARRFYSDTVDLWKSRVEPGLAHYQSAGKITAADVQRIKGLSPYDQVSEIFKLEAQGMYFSKDLAKPIIYSVAPPGTSQHLSMLALDVSEFENAKVRDVLAKHGWYQTVVSDLPHFTYLGVPESDLPKLGLKKVVDGGRTFWVPDI